MDHGLDFNNEHFKIWLGAVPALFSSLVNIFRFLGWWNFKTRRGSRASDIMAFQIVAGLCVIYLSGAGIIGYFSLFGVNEYERLSKDPWFGKSAFIENHLLYPMISYQGWNIVLCLFNKDLNDLFMILHHIATAVLAYFMLAPYAQYQCFFFSGIVEISNIPLTIMDIFKYFPDLAKQYSTINSLSRTMFGISFIVLRLIIWPVLTYYFITGSINLLVTNTAHNQYIVIFFIICNILLTALQLFWGSKIIHILLFKKSSSTSKTQKDKL